MSGRSIKRGGLLLTILLLLLILLGGAGWYWHVQSRGIHLSPTEFLHKAGSDDLIGSIEFDRYAGHQDGKVMFKSWRMARFPKEIVYWTELEGLPPATIEEIRAGTGRWQVKGPGH